MKKLRAAVIGVGYLGRFHAQKYAQLQDVDLIGISDVDVTRASEFAESVNTEVFPDYRALLDKVDIVSVVVPTQLHYEITSFFLDNSVHVLLEKPMTTTLKEAEQLVETASANNLVLQIGHLERFNPSFAAVKDKLHNPGFIEAVRIAPFKPRGTDVSVVLDLMIHDIEIIQSFVKADIVSVHATGAPVYSKEPDIVSARIEFSSGCVANLTASRVSFKSERKMRIFQQDSYIIVDFQNKKSEILKKGEVNITSGVSEIMVEQLPVTDKDQILAETEAFIDSVRNGTPVLVTGKDGMRALETALIIDKKVKESIEKLSLQNN
ncbi:MAG: Gfo/Idh/MocA family oxidoreductase [Desulfuromonadales bacterium]|nr:Gfo/Idh/MocA family oxidoreductase [Desulfuromonadales bacterium]